MLFVLSVPFSLIFRLVLCCIVVGGNILFCHSQSLCILATESTYISYIVFSWSSTWGGPVLYVDSFLILILNCKNTHNFRCFGVVVLCFFRECQNFIYRITSSLQIVCRIWSRTTKSFAVLPVHSVLKQLCNFWRDISWHVKMLLIGEVAYLWKRLQNMCLLAQNYSLCVLRLKFTGYEYVPLICQKYILQLRKTVM
jgi:hypothetical protein